MATQRPLSEFLSSRWPNVSLVVIFLAGTLAITVAMLSNHTDQVTGIITFAGVAAAGVITLYRIDSNRDDVAQKIENAKSVVVSNQANTENKIDQAKKTAEVAAVKAEVAATKVEKARQETVGMLSDQNQVMDEIRKNTNGEGPIAELARKVDTVIETVAGHGEILKKLSEKGRD